MLRKQVVTAPSGERWQVGRHWLNKPPPKPWTRLRRRKRGDNEDSVDWLNDPTGFLDLDDDFLAGIVLALALVVVAVLLAFVILPLLGIVLELGLLIALFTSGLFGRIVLRRPWTIEAVNVDRPEQHVQFTVKGWRRSRRAIGALAEAIARTGPPSALPEATPIAANS